jgi:hypothetical protein
MSNRRSPRIPSAYHFPELNLMPTPQKSRIALREAIAAYGEALDQLHRAENVLARANEMLVALMAKRADFDTLDSQIATARANLVKQALDDEDNAQLHGQLLTEEPPGFAAAKCARENLDQKIDGVRDSIKVLEEEVLESRRAAEHADYALDCCREGVFANEAKAMCDDFLARLMEVRKMWNQIRHMAIRQMRRTPGAVDISGRPYCGNGGMRQISMPPSVALALREDPMGDFDRRGGLKLRDDVGRAVADWWARLRVDPLATFEAEEILIEDRGESIIVKDAAE